MSVSIQKYAADVHALMARDNRFGYSWEERYGAYDQLYRIDDVDTIIRTGDYDCSSSVITAWNIALEKAGFGRNKIKATYTGNMLGGFLSTGLFMTIPISERSQGDVLLNVSNHTAMVQSFDTLSEARINEHGGTHGGKRGDQTGNEFRLSPYYNYPWDYCIRCKLSTRIGEDMAISKNDVREIWAYRNDKFENKDAYQILRDTRDMCKQLLKEIAAVESEIVKSKEKQ